MRVCMAYTGGLTPRKGGGIASVINNIVEHTSKEIDYLLLTIYDETEQSEIQEIYPSTVKIEYVKPSGNVFARLMYYLAKNVGDFDILHFHDFPLGSDFPLALKMHLRRKKLLYSHHISLEELINSRLVLGYYYSVFNRFRGIWTRIVTNSDFIVDSDLARFRSLRDKTCLIRNGVDVEKLSRAKPIHLEGEPSLLFLGHLIYRKGIDILLEAFNMLSSHGIRADPKLHIVGSGALEKNCKEYVARSGLCEKVRFWGAVRESLKFKIMKGADIVAVPSRYESAPIVLLEAMAAGKPVIATRVGGIPEIFEHRVNGILAYPSSREIAMAIKFLSENQQLVEEYGRNNQEIAFSFAWEKIAQLYVELYNSVVNDDFLGTNRKD